MPAFSTHYIFSCEMMDFLEKQADFKLIKEAVWIGTQGPDVFYFHRILPWMRGKSLRKIGSVLHRTDPAALFDAMAEYCRFSANKAIAKSYANGFILHYSLDRICHPFVYAGQNKMTEANRSVNAHSAHNIIELSMDSVMLHTRMCMQRPECFDASETITKNPGIVEEVSAMIAYLVSRVTEFPLKKSDAQTAISDMRSLQKILVDETGTMTKAVSFLDCLSAPFTHHFALSSMLRPRDLETAKKYGNIDNCQWESPFEKGKRNESFNDLFELAKQDAKKLISGFSKILNGFSDGNTVTQNISFLTGVSIYENDTEL